MNPQEFDGTNMNPDCPDRCGGCEKCMPGVRVVAEEEYLKLRAENERLRAAAKAVAEHINAGLDSLENGPKRDIDLDWILAKLEEVENP